MEATLATQSDLIFPIHNNLRFPSPHRGPHHLAHSDCCLSQLQPNSTENGKHTHSKRLSTWHQKCFNCSHTHNKNYSPINYTRNFNLVKVFLRFPPEQLTGCKGHHKALGKLTSVWPQEFSDYLLSAVICISHIWETTSSCKSSCIRIRKTAYRTTQVWPDAAASSAPWREGAATLCISLNLWHMHGAGVTEETEAPYSPVRLLSPHFQHPCRTGRSTQYRRWIIQHSQGL